SAFRSSAGPDQPRIAQALGAYYRHDWNRGLTILQPTNLNDPNVQFVRALLLLGQGTIDSTRTGQSLLQTAANTGQRQAGGMLGRTLMGWQGLTKDEARGRKLIEDGAAAGDSYAQRLAAIGYLSREFGSYDPAKAVDLMRRAADGGDPGAMIQYARFLHTGFGGLTRDEPKAIDYLRRSAEAGFTGAQTMLADWIWERYRNNETDDASEGVQWYERAYQRGFSFYALVELAYNLRAGRAPPFLDTAKSFSLFQLCAPYAYGYCHYWLGNAYQTGTGTGQDLIKAYAHYSVARQIGVQPAAVAV